MDAQRPPIGPPPVLTPPSGWLGYLGIKSGGKQPQQVAQFLQPTIDMDQFYKAGARSNLFNSGTVLPGANGTRPFVLNGATLPMYVAPPGKVTILEEFSFSCGVLGVAAGVIATPVLIDGVVSGFPIYYGPSSVRGLTGEVIVGSLGRRVVMSPGSYLAIWTTAAAAPTAFSYFGFGFGAEVSA